VGAAQRLVAARMKIRKLSSATIEAPGWLATSVTRNCSGPLSRFLLTLTLVAAYIGVGIVFYSQVEHWTFIESAYFSMVTMSTVGYGDYTPSNGWSRLFTVFYTLVGIVVVFVELAALMTTIAAPLVVWLRAQTGKYLPHHGYDIDGNGKADYFVPQAALAYYMSKLFLPCCALCGLQLVFSGLFAAVEGWDYGTSLYHCMVTATTTGYGEISIASEGGRVLAFFHIAVSVSLLGAFLAEIDLVRQERRALLRRHEVMLAKMDPAVWESVLTDTGDSVRQIDFVCGMLVNFKLIEQNDIDVLTKLWGRLGKSNDGTIERSELKSIASAYSSRRTLVPPPFQAPLTPVSAAVKETLVRIGPFVRSSVRRSSTTPPSAARRSTVEAPTQMEQPWQPAS